MKAASVGPATRPNIFSTIGRTLPDLEKKGLREEDAIRDWDALPAVEAVKKGRVYAITEGYAAITGPRFVFTLERIARILHPDVKWDG